MNFSVLDERCAHPDLKELGAYCERIADGRPLPRREDFRLADVRWMAGRLYMVDVLEGGADYFFRLFGVFWQEILGVDLTGQRLSGLEVFGFLSSVRPDYDKVVASRQPLFHPGQLVWPNRRTIHYERLLIPLSRGDGQVSLILGAAQCDMDLNDLSLFRGTGLPRLILDDEKQHSADFSTDALTSAAL